MNLKDNRTCILRPVEIKDTEAMIEYLRTVSSETPFLLKNISNGNLRLVYHRCGFAIALKEAYWNLGIGSAMMDYACSLAKEMGYEQMELEVVNRNHRAKRLYERFGFKEKEKNSEHLNMMTVVIEMSTSSSDN